MDLLKKQQRKLYISKFSGFTVLTWYTHGLLFMSNSSKDNFDL